MKISFLIATAMIFLTACGAGPTKRYVDGSWDVSENICSSDPSKPDLVDMRSEIRKKQAYQTSLDQKISIFYLDKTILIVSANYTRAGFTGNAEYYENSTANSVIKTNDLRNNRELNNAIDSGIKLFFENDSNIDGKEAKSFCLFRGQ